MFLKDSLSFRKCILKCSLNYFVGVYFKIFGGRGEMDKTRLTINR